LEKKKKEKKPMRAKIHPARLGDQERLRVLQDILRKAIVLRKKRKKEEKNGRISSAPSGLLTRGKKVDLWRDEDELLPEVPPLPRV